MFHAPVFITLVLCQPQETTLGEFRQGLYTGTMAHGANLRLRLEDTPDQPGRCRGTLAGFDPKGLIDVSGELTGTRIKLSRIGEGRMAVDLAEGSVVPDEESEGRYARLDLRFLIRPPLPEAPPEKIQNWVARLDHDDPMVRHEATGALYRVSAADAMTRCLECARSPEVRTRIAEILHERVVFRQVSRDVATELSLDKTVRARCRFPLMVAAPAALKREVLELERKAFDRVQAEYRDFVTELEDEEAGPRFRNYEEEWGVSFASGPLLSLSALVSCYSGGAHPNYYFQTETRWCDGEEVRRVRLADLFQPCSYWQNRLSDLGIALLTRAGASSVVDGAVRELDEEDLSNWALTPTGIEFQFAPYAMGCFAEGAYIIEVRYSEIADLLRTDGPSSFLPRR